MPIKKEAVELVEKFSNARGISGFEDEVVAIARDYVDTDFDVTEDNMRNLYINNKANTGDAPVIQFDAHSDEVGFIVQAIKPNGTLVFLAVGGWIASNVAAQKVLVRNSEGEYIAGVVASKPPHFTTDAERNQPLTLDSLVIDLGASSKEEVENEYKIAVGAPIVPDTSFHYNEKNKLFFGKAFDCRIGCAALVETMKILKDESLNVDLKATITAQEEVGLRGAQVAVKKVNPDIAIVFEGTPADDTFTESWLIQSALKKGPMLRHFDVSMITNPRFQKFALDTARKHKIPVQDAVRKGGGTNGAAINLYNGIPAIVIGIPVRYAHTPHCYVAAEDYQNAINLAVAITKELTAEIIATL